MHIFGQNARKFLENIEILFLQITSFFIGGFLR